MDEEIFFVVLCENERINDASKGYLGTHFEVVFSEKKPFKIRVRCIMGA